MANKTTLHLPELKTEGIFTMLNQSNLAEVQSELREATAFITPLRSEIGRIIAGQEKLVDRLIMALITGGHVLIEGVPGLAKTLAVKTLSQTLSASYSRVQFTPDLLPADLVAFYFLNLSGVNLFADSLLSK